MNQNRIFAALLTILGAYPQVSSEAEPPLPESTRGFILRIQEEAAAPIVSLCIAKVPELKSSLEAAYATFKANFREASVEVLDKAPNAAELAKPVPPEMVADFSRTNELMLAQIKTLDPKLFCPQLRANLATPTVAALRAQIEASIARYTSQAR